MFILLYPLSADGIQKTFYQPNKIGQLGLDLYLFFNI